MPVKLPLQLGAGDMGERRIEHGNKGLQGRVRVGA